MRSTRADVRNPLLKLPSAAELEALPAAALEALRRLAADASRAWRAQGELCWRKSKPPMAAYWRAQSVNARHLAILCAGIQRRRAEASL